MTSIQYKITPEDLFRSVQYTRLQTELSIIEERLQATAPEEISAEDGFFKRGFRRVKNRLKNTATPSLEEKRQATLKKLDSFFCAHSTADIRILERGEEAKVMRELFGEEEFSVGRDMFLIRLLLDRDYTYLYEADSLRLISERLTGDENALPSMGRRLKELLGQIGKRPLTPVQTVTLIGAGALLSTWMLAVPLSAVGAATASATALGAGGTLGVGLLSLFSFLVGGTLFGLCYAGVDLYNKQQIKEAFRNLSAEEAALALSIRCLLIERSQGALSAEAFKEGVNDLLCCVDDLRADTLYELCVERQNTEQNREKVRLFHNFDNTLVSILEA